MKLTIFFQRKSINKMGLRNYMEKLPKGPFIGTCIVILVCFAVSAWLWDFSTPITLDTIDWESIPVVFAILGVFFIFIFFCLFPLSNVSRRKRIEALNRLAKRYGNLDGNISEIEQQLKQKDITITINGDMITKDWLIASYCLDICKISSIVAIVGIMNSGTFILLDDRSVIKTMFHQKKWGEIFNLFKASNPNILSSDDTIFMPNGKDLDVYEAYRDGDYALIIDEYLRRKN